MRGAFSAQCLARDAWLARAPCYLADGDRMIGSRRIIGLDWILYRVVSMSRRTDGRSAASADRGSVQPSLPATRSSVVLNESLQTQHCIAEVVLSVVGIWKCDRKFTLVLPSLETHTNSLFYPNTQQHSCRAEFFFQYRQLTKLLSLLFYKYFSDFHIHK